MSFQHRTYIDEFLDAIGETGTPTNDAEDKAVDIVEADAAPGETYWRCIGVHHLRPDENEANHHVYLEALDEEGRRVTAPHAWVGWTWEGRTEDDEAPPTPLDKPANEPAGNVPVWKGQTVSVWINGLTRDGTDASDRVEGIHTDHPDEKASDGSLGNSRFHHSFYVVFQRTQKGAAAEVDEGSDQAQPAPAPTPEEEPVAEAPEEAQPERTPVPGPAPAQPQTDDAGVHKYGFHVNRTGDDVFDAIRRIKPRVIKTLDHNPDYWKRVREIHPDAFLIGRLFVPRQQQEAFVENPTGQGRAFAEQVLRLEANSVTVDGRPLFDAWESYNEVIPDTVDDDTKRAYDDFQVAFGERIKRAGFIPIAMNFGTGNFLGPDFVNFFPGTLETYDYLGFHEYDWPTMRRLHEQNIREKNEGGMWLTLRYRRIMKDVRREYGDRHTVIITECGMTQGVQGRDDVGPWHESHPVAEADYWKSLMWYNDELMKDDYVMAALLFVVGAVSPWESFEHLGGIVNRLEQFQSTA